MSFFFVCKIEHYIKRNWTEKELAMNYFVAKEKNKNFKKFVVSSLNIANNIYAPWRKHDQEGQQKILWDTHLFQLVPRHLYQLDKTFWSQFLIIIFISLCKAAPFPQKKKALVRSPFIMCSFFWKVGRGCTQFTLLPLYPSTYRVPTYLLSVCFLFQRLQMIKHYTVNRLNKKINYNKLLNIS